MANLLDAFNWVMVNWPVIIAPLVCLILNDLVYCYPKLKANTLLSFLLPMLQKYYPSGPPAVPPSK